MNGTTHQSVRTSIAGVNGRDLLCMAGDALVVRGLVSVTGYSTDEPAPPDYSTDMPEQGCKDVPQPSDSSLGNDVTTQEKYSSLNTETRTKFGRPDDHGVVWNPERTDKRGGTRTGNNIKSYLDYAVTKLVEAGGATQEEKLEHVEKEIETVLLDDVYG